MDIVQSSKVFKTLEVYRDENEMQPPFRWLAVVFEPK